MSHKGFEHSSYNFLFPLGGGPGEFFFFFDFIFPGTASLHLDAHVPLLGGTGEKVF